MTGPVIHWRCRHCKCLTSHVRWSQGKWPLCEACYLQAYRKWAGWKNLR